MANIVEAVLDAASAAIASIGTVLLGGSTTRDIGGIIPDVSIGEIGKDTTFITDHPVERGAAITDHAFMMPPEIEMRVGWSDSTGGFEGYSAAIYQSILALQSARQPFDVVTSKRIYSDMLVQSVENTTDVRSEFALMIRIVLRNIILVDLQSSSTGIQGSNPNQADPASTANPVNQGTQQTVPSNVGSGAFIPSNVG